MLMRISKRLLPLLWAAIIFLLVAWTVYNPKYSVDGKEKEGNVVEQDAKGSPAPTLDIGDHGGTPVPGEMKEQETQSLEQNQKSTMDHMPQQGKVPPNGDAANQGTTPKTKNIPGKEDFDPYAPSAFAGTIPTNELPPFNPNESNHQIFSISSSDRKFFQIDFGTYDAINPNIIPHPSLEKTWIIVAMRQASQIPMSVFCAELVCNAVFNAHNTKLSCLQPPVILPIAQTAGGSKCTGELDHLNLNIGPHDARVFYGPQNPYIIYGSNSLNSCFGQWMLDFRLLTDWGFEIFNDNEFRFPTDLQRPVPALIEKNWFVFWDLDNNLYVHYVIFPSRSFARLNFDGSVGEDLGPLATALDSKCTAHYMPPLAPRLESIHQATNSLSVTMCKRADSTCQANSENTFVFTIFQHKSYYQYHSLYWPYVMMFRQRAPFELYAMSKKPLWISGRGGPGTAKRPPQLLEEESKTWWQTEMFYVTSMSWREKGMKYHGYLDDVLFLTFGIEDERSGGIDVRAEDLLGALGICSEVT